MCMGGYLNLIYNSIIKKLDVIASNFFSLCRGGDLNSHGLPRLLLRQVRLPISPPRHIFMMLLFTLPLVSTKGKWLRRLPILAHRHR